MKTEDRALVQEVEAKLAGLKRTASCLTCGQRATNFCGHVLCGDEQIIAGWCETHAEQEQATSRGEKVPPMGYHGQWKPWMGIKEF